MVYFVQYTRLKRDKLKTVMQQCRTRIRTV